MLAKLSLQTPIAKVSGIGPTYSQRLENLGIQNVRDLLFYFPFRYEDLSNEEKIINLTSGSKVTIVATIWQITKIRTRTGKTLIKAVVNDSSGSLACIWFNQEYLLTVLKPNQLISLSGKVDIFGGKLTLINPKYEFVKPNSELVHTKRLVPIYSESFGLTTRWLRSKIYSLLNEIGKETKETLPDSVTATEGLMELGVALRQIHFPENQEAMAKARERFAFEELFYLQLRNLRTQKVSLQDQRAFKINLNTFLEFKKLLSFKLTSSQEKAISEILADLNSEEPMNRLLQGEVGSGKTIVAASAIYSTVKSGFQAAFMAPTEILAKQHYETLKSLFGSEIKVALATSSIKPKEKDFEVIVGTHAILSSSVLFEQLALVVVDEQQRFGVAQRKLLREKGKMVHYLTMTATPIPRTLALTINGNLKISVLEESPFGEKKIRTYLVPSFKREKAYSFIEKKVLTGEQVFLVCPLINTTESLQSVKSAEFEYERLKKEVFPNLKLALLHGKMPVKKRDHALLQFREGKAQILVATPVVEVGVDIPKASIIVIEAAERFGLASLHQLRGRVGRSGQESFCLLFTETNSEKALERLKLLEKSDNGFDLAELDLKLRGPGDIFGTLQHGKLELKTADFFNLDVLTRARNQANKAFTEGQNLEIFEQLSTWFPQAPIASND